MAEQCDDPARTCPFDQIMMGKMIQKLDDIHEDVGDIKKSVKIQNGRIGKLENWRWYITGGIVVLGLFVKLWTG